LFANVLDSLIEHCLAACLILFSHMCNLRLMWRALLLDSTSTPLGIASTK
jgi:hypothetical protein